MGVIMEITRIVLPIAITGGIVVFVIKRLEHKHKQGTLGKKKTKGAQNLLDSLIPIGALLGCLVGVMLGMFSSISTGYTITLGAGIGYLFGYFAYEIYSKTGESSA